VDALRTGARYIIFDDVPVRNIPNLKGWFGAQGSITVTGKYRAPRNFEWGRPCMFLCNGDMDPLNVFEYGSDEREWLDANITYIRLERPLF